VEDEAGQTLAVVPFVVGNRRLPTNNRQEKYGAVIPGRTA
jgi:hypothetical protein